MAKRLEDSNIYHIEVLVRFHSIIFPFWKKLLPDMKVELFERQVKNMPSYAYEYFKCMQDFRPYKLNIYNLLYDTDEFIQQIESFNINYNKSFK